MRCSYADVFLRRTLGRRFREKWSSTYKTTLSFGHFQNTIVLKTMNLSVLGNSRRVAARPIKGHCSPLWVPRLWRGNFRRRHGRDPVPRRGARVARLWGSSAFGGGCPDCHQSHLPCGLVWLKSGPFGLWIFLVGGDPTPKVGLLFIVGLFYGLFGWEVFPHLKVGLVFSSFGWEVFPHLKVGLVFSRSFWVGGDPTPKVGSVFSGSFWVGGVADL